MSFERILGVVMAGGASRRMGFDKRGLELEGRTLVERSVAVLEPVCDQVVVSMQPGDVWESAAFRTIHDRRAYCGPLAGLESALEEGSADGSSVFLLACDMPHVSTRVVRHVLGCAGERSDSAAVVPSFAGRYQPLCALYRITARAAVQRHLESGHRSMHELLDAIPVLEVEIGPGLPFFRPGLFHNLNEPADLVDVAADAKL